MRTLKFMAFILLTCTMTLSLASPKKNVKASKVSKNAKLGTSFKFDGSALRGKYQSSLGTNATVESDKYLDDLLGGRKKFDDRIQEEQKRN